MTDLTRTIMKEASKQAFEDAARKPDTVMTMEHLHEAKRAIEEINKEYARSLLQSGLSIVQFDGMPENGAMLVIGSNLLRHINAIKEEEGL